VAAKAVASSGGGGVDEHSKTHTLMQQRVIPARTVLLRASLRGTLGVISKELYATTPVTIAPPMTQCLFMLYKEAVKQYFTHLKRLALCAKGPTSPSRSLATPLCNPKSRAELASV
jgi:hypothetical protein